MKRALCIAAVMMAGFVQPAAAQLLAEEICPRARDPLEQSECAVGILAEADRALNAVWKRAMREHPSGGDPGMHRKEIRASQRAWIKFRDLDCEAASKIGIPRYWGINKLSCLIAHTRARTRALQELYVE